MTAKFSSLYSCRIRKKVVRVQDFVAAEVISIPVELSGARPGIYDYVCSAPSAILSIVERILNLKLLDCIGRRNRQPTTAVRSGLSHIGAVAVCVHSVQHEVVVATTRTIGANLLASGSQLCRIHHISVRPGRQTENLCVVAVHKWQGHNRSSIDNSSECGVVGLQQRSFDYDFLSCA